MGLNAMYFEVRFNNKVEERNLPLMSPGGYEISDGKTAIAFDFYMSKADLCNDPKVVRYTVYDLDLGSFPEAETVTRTMLMQGIFTEFYLHIADEADASLRPVAIESLEFGFGNANLAASGEQLVSASECIHAESGYGRR